MMKKWCIPLLLTLLVLTAGCYRSQVRNDGDQVRHALLDMFTNQTMDNLIRAHQNLPFVQLNYHDVIVQATDQYTGTLSNNQTFTGSRSLSYGSAIAATLIHTVGSAFTFGGTAQRQDLLSFKADPITDQDDIYDMYMSFANNPTLLVVSDCPPPKEVVHHGLVRKCDGCYYYIPCSASEKFMQLVLSTTMQRGFNSARYGYPVTVKGTIDLSRFGPAFKPGPNQVNVMIYFDAKVPNGSGLLLLRLPQTGRTVTLRVRTVVDDRIAGKTWPGNGEEIDHLQALWDLNESKFGPDAIKYAKGQLLSDDYPAPFTTIDTIVRKANNNLESIRANTSIVTLKPPLSP